ncbi:maleylacetate reductase [Micromonospora sp. A200]|uniref:maleylacetate reductase n=1 Tax=Micromonospora sp. A200 TaxID=2940568 RepID=UPI002477163A|nr:maleylacetate reductase [Micromonospora sp. A200]MDH6464638.1 maleylacetate reductase [Micromonospora sp. A200]
MRGRFTHETLPQRVVFASYEAAGHLADEVARLGAVRPMVIAAESDSALADPLVAALPAAVRHTEVAMHVPTDVAERARTAAEEHDVDVLVSIGGGSTTGLAKAVALTTGLPIVAVPTTYAGSEATNVWGLTEGGRKTTGVDARVLPRSVVYDASLTLSLPVPLSVASGLNALAHCVDSMWAPRVDPIDQALALEGIRALRQGLPEVALDPQGIDGREQTLYGAYLAAVAFASAGSGLHHKICHVLGGMYNLPHAQTHAVVLPYVLALNAPSVPDSEQRMAAAFGETSALDGLQRLREQVAAPRALRDYGLREIDIPAAVDAVLAAVPPNNPTPVTRENLEDLLRRAWDGGEPR